MKGQQHAVRERLITLAAAAGALVLFAALLVQSGSVTERRDAPRPATDEQRAAGYHAAFAWLQEQGVHVVALRERLTALARRRDVRPTGNLLVETLPGVTGFEAGELRALDRWIRAGNAVLVLAALDDSPAWAAPRSALAPADVNLLTGLLFEPLRREARRRAFPRAAEVSLLVPNGAHLYFENVREAAALADRSWGLRIPYSGFALELAHSRGSGAGVLWTRSLGAGRIVLSTLGSLFTNRTLALADNAQLLANVVAANVTPRGAVIFDDLRQGRGAVYDPARFYRDPRLYATLSILLALWLTWVLGSTRLHAPEDHGPAPGENDLLHATAGLLARVLGSADAARSLLAHFLAAVPAACIQERPDVQLQRFEYLARHPRMSAADLEQLRSWYADAQVGRRVPLRRLQSLIARAERRLRS
ncbi:MAG TPA: DUF4350 domain-containing protein [Steroidobacteraceae bacterium]|nr:DUF4350 domain-containing protein [Steroidobacteraceae bacterium]